MARWTEVQRATAASWLVAIGGAVALGCVESETRMRHSGGVRLNEVMAYNRSFSDRRGDRDDWIELYNGGAAPVALRGYTLRSEVGNRDHWTFPDITLAPDEYVIVFASGRDRGVGVDTVINPAGPVITMSAAFRIDADGDAIQFASPSGEPIDRVVTGTIPVDLTVGRSDEVPVGWVYFDEPTPGMANDATWFAGFTETPGLVPQPGFHDAPVRVQLSPPDAADGVRYTTDGRPPTPEDPLFPDSLLVEETQVIRIARWTADHRRGMCRTATYLVGETTTFPVVSIAVAPDLLFDEIDGAYVPGPNPGDAPRFDGANYRQDIEVPAHVEFFESDRERVLAQEAGLELHGDKSRVFAKKSLRVKARRRFGLGTFDYPLLPQKDTSRYRDVVLRNGGNDQPVMIRNVLAHRMVVDTPLCFPASRPTVVFINGDYWGIHFLREPYDEAYPKNNFGVGERDLDFADMLGRWRIRSGDGEDLDELMRLAGSGELEDSEGVLERLVDVEDFALYLAVQVYIGTRDWPHKNVRIWKSTEPGSRWRCILFDVDNSFGMKTGPEYDALAMAIAPGEEHTILFRALIANTRFRHEFVRAMEDCLNVLFVSDRVLDEIEVQKRILEPEFPRDNRRWGLYPEPATAAWDGEIQVIRDWSRARPAAMIAIVQKHFGLAAPTRLEFDVTPPGSGTVQVNGQICPELPWSGLYFEEVPKRLVATPSPGHRFVRWKGGLERAEPELVASVAPGSRVTAVFAPR